MRGMEKREKKRLAKSGSADNPKLRTDWFIRVRVKFQRIMAITLTYRYLVFSVFIVMLIGSISFAYLNMQFILFPGNTAENFFITVELPTGSSLDATEDKIKEIEAILQALPEDEMQSHMAILGSLGGGGFFTPGESENWAFIIVTLTPYSELKIPNRRGRLIQLKEVAEFEIGPGPSRYFHYEEERTVTITADITLGDLTPLQATKKAVNHFDLTSDWPGMRFVIGGEAEETQESVVSLGITMLTALVGIYFVLILLFNSVTQPFLVVLAIPFGLIGVIGAFAMHGEPLGFLAIMGVIGLMGVVVNDSLILVNYINIHRESEPDKKIKRIVAEGTATRLRPIILTSITTIAGILPLAYGLGGSDPFIAPMALALGYGILFATPLTLLLLPCLYMILDDVGRGFGFMKRLVFRG